MENQRYIMINYGIDIHVKGALYEKKPDQIYFSIPVNTLPGYHNRKI